MSSSQTRALWGKSIQQVLVDELIPLNICGECTFYDPLEYKCVLYYPEHKRPEHLACKNFCKKPEKENEMKPIEILRACYPARREIIPCLLGAPGIGKTQCVYQLGDELGVAVHMMNMNGKTPSEIVGMAMPNKEDSTMDMFDYGIISKANDGDIIIIDEMLTAAPACLNAILTLAESRILPSGKHIADVFIVAAANPLTSPGRISLATRDRFQFINVRWDMVDWSDYIEREYGKRPTDQITRKIKLDGNDYNVLTPRTATKYIWWLSKVCKTKAERNEVYKIIRQVFDSSVSDSYMLMFEASTPEEKFFEALGEIGVHVAKDEVKIDVCYNGNIISHFDPTGDEEIDIPKLYEIMSEHPYWNEIKDKLSRISMD